MKTYESSPLARPAAPSARGTRRAHEEGLRFPARQARRSSGDAARKSRITIRLDDTVLDWFRDQVEQAGGGNYQTLINRALREHVERRREPLEATLRRVIREELRNANRFQGSTRSG